MKKLFHFGQRAHAVRPAHAGACANCHAPVSEKFCGQCGQASHVHVASAHEFIHHFIGHYIAVEGKLWRTLWALLARPGQLTLDYIRGRRGQFIDPLRLLLSVSLVAFLVMKWQVHHLAPAAPAVQVQAEATPATAAQAVHYVDRHLFGVFARASDHLAGNYGKFLALSPEVRGAQFWETWLRTGPTVILCLIPLLALALKAMHLGTGWRYGEHLVFAMHLQTIGLIASIVMVGGMTGLTKPLLWAGMFLYILLAMRKVYGGGWVVLLLRVAALAYCMAAGFEWLVRIAFLLRFI